MKLFNAAQIKAWDEFTIKNKPISSEDLMELAATKCFEEIKQLAANSHIIPVFKVFCGTGNNGGDGLVIARLLLQHQYQVEVYIIKSRNQSAEFKKNLDKIKLLKPDIQYIDESFVFVEPNERFTAIDAIFGSGLNKPLIGYAAQTVNHINRFADFTISVDIPSGLPVDTTDTEILKNQSIIEANLTLTFQIPKFCMLFAECYRYVGNFKVIDIGLLPEFEKQTKTNRFYITASDIKKILKPKSKFSHKGTYGHLLVAGGSYGKFGSIILSSKAGLATGCGLLTAYIPKTGFTILQTALPEAMVITDDEMFELRNFSSFDFADAVAIGMGMGTLVQTQKALYKFLQQLKKPVVIDADGLNCCAGLLFEHPDFRFPENCILTPHPKEFDRLAGYSSNSFERFEKQLNFSKKHQVYVVLKQAHTCVTTPTGEAYFNSSGNPLLATAGSGDVLTGIIGSMLAQGYSCLDACLAAVYIHGACADRHFYNKYATMLSGNIADYIGKVIYELNFE